MQYNLLAHLPWYSISIITSRVGDKMVVEVRPERFLDVALLNTGPLSTSYKEKKLKWMIRDHLLSLTSEFPTFKLSMASFSYDDGVTAKLLKATGVLPCFNILITIWIPQSYPLLPPILFLSSSSSGVPIVHPYVDPSTGLTTIPYLTMWDNKKYNKLDEVVRNLVWIFKLSYSSNTGHVRVSSFPSRREAIDRLAIHLLNDMARFNGEVKEEKDKVLIIRSRLKERAILSSDVIAELNQEHIILQRKVKKMESEAKEISKWLEGCDMPKQPESEVKEAFQAIDEKSNVQIEHKAADDAIYETMRKMDEAMGKGVIPFDVYLKQVRALALEQFDHRSMLMEVNKEPRFILG